MYTSFITENCHTYAFSYRAGLVFVGIPFFIPADMSASFLDALFQSVGMEGNSVGGIYKALLYAVFQAELAGIHADGISQIVGQTLCKPVSLRDSVGSHGACCRRRGVDCPAVYLSAQTIPIQILKYISAVGTDSVTVRGIGSVVCISFQLTCQDLSVLCYNAAAFSLDGVACACAGNGFFTADFQSYRPSAYRHGKKCI